MNSQFDRRHMLQAGAVAGLVATAATPSEAQSSPPPKLSTHALDMYLGKQAAGIRIDFSKLEGTTYKLIKTVQANEDGRVPENLLTAETIAVGRYELLFYVDEYYKKLGVKVSDPAYLDTVPVRIAIFDAKQPYHVPLYFSPWSFMSYRGS